MLSPPQFQNTNTHTIFSLVERRKMRPIIRYNIRRKLSCQEKEKFLKSRKKIVIKKSLNYISGKKFSFLCDPENMKKNAKKNFQRCNNWAEETKADNNKPTIFLKRTISRLKKKTGAVSFETSIFGVPDILVPSH